MLTKNEVAALSLSPTKKDFVQIWNELLDIAGKLSERWDPTSTNESDPGIVILKALTGIADKLNYNIDKNTLEAFMPTAAQEDSMRKLCDMLGYSIKYYRSAETDVTIRYHKLEDDEADGVWEIPKFTVITNDDQDVSYFTVNQRPYYISTTTPYVTLKCMEGQIVQCESVTDNNVITAEHISENNRFYLPEAQIAENGIFVYNVYSAGETLCDGTHWDRVDNLNIQAHGSRVFKFGYDSYESRPYIEFPADYSELVNEGLFIYYARTSGAGGNVSPRTLTKLELPSSWEDVSSENFSVENTFAATTGANIETIKQAYNNYKKTIGTFETLVTCRDYMNKIYTLTDSNGKAVVSNVLVTDIRNDLNRAVTICSCDDSGIFYKDTPLTTTTTKTFNAVNGDTVDVYVQEPAIDYFDLVLYPFKSYSQLKNTSKNIQETYDESFEYSAKNFTEVEKQINNLSIKTIAHNIIPPRINDLVCINNYLRLSVLIGTTTKITIEEGELLKEIIKLALANAFNMRELDFGEEIPFESLVEVIENADPRIKVVSLNEPALYTTYSVFDGIKELDGTAKLKEYAVASEWFTQAEADATGRFNSETFNSVEAKKIYNKLALRNVLAGRVQLFKYSTTFNSSFSEGAYQVTTSKNEEGAPLTIKDMPEGFVEPSADNPFVVQTVDGVIYTGQYQPTVNSEPDSDEGSGSGSGSGAGSTPGSGATPDTSPDVADTPVIYTKTYVPELFKQGVITGNNDKNITEITTSCKILATPVLDNEDDPTAAGNQISNVELSSGEFIRFRAKNFITTKTYPAYVNYHLKLQSTSSSSSSSSASPARPATATSLYSLLSSGDALDKNWPKAVNYLSQLGASRTFSLSQRIVYTPPTEPAETPTEGEIVMEDVDNPAATPEESFAEILMNSGCIRLAAHGVPEIGICDGEEGGDPAALAAIDVNNFKINFNNNSEYIFTVDTFSDIKTKVNNYITSEATSALFDAVQADCFIRYTFEYVPFDPSTLQKWNQFIADVVEKDEAFNINPVEEFGNYLYRAYGEGYAPGRYVMDNTSKLLSFTSSYFGLLSNFTTRLHGIYVVTDLGADAKSSSVSNNTEYMLREGERLYIEYTPSSTTEDGTTKTGESVKEIYEAGTIIRPIGFEADTGLVDSTAYAASHTPFKTVAFNETTRVGMHSLGANEQIEIRDFAKVTLNEETFRDSAVVYVYKNFKCPELETASYENGERINNSYTLKDGEYVFYTDQNKAEYACFTTGTEVVLNGSVKIPERKIIDLATLLDNGPQDIPWAQLKLSRNDSIDFIEYQYITLGPGDTLKDLTIVGPNPYLSSDWQYCDGVKYLPAGAENPVGLDPISIYDDASKGNGWEACSILELNVSPSRPQVLRTSDKVETSIQLHDDSSEAPLEIKAADPDYPISFKTNLVCQASNSKITISDLYNNPNELDHFEIKVFADNAPSVVKTKIGTTIPYVEVESEEPVDMAKLPVVQDTPITTYSKFWNALSLVELGTVPAAYETVYENAIKLSVSVLPKTYGIFSIYIDSSDTQTTWIELLPGVSRNAIKALSSGIAWTVVNDIGTVGLKLKQGLNCLMVDTTCELFIKTTKGSTGTLCFDELRLVDISDSPMGVNLDQIGYFYIEEGASGTSVAAENLPHLTEQQLLADIRKVDTNSEFYYNVPIESSVAIDFDESTVVPDTLLNPFLNYDINNVNNNFVISKLDIKHLSTGLQIARSSRIS